jgi:hypothetical protein
MQIAAIIHYLFIISYLFGIHSFCYQNKPQNLKLKEKEELYLIIKIIHIA